MTISNRFESHKRLLTACGFFSTLAVFSSTHVEAGMDLLAQGIVLEDAKTGTTWRRAD